MDAILLKAGSLMLIIAIGYGIKRRGWVSASDFPIFSNIVLRITLPCALAVSFDTFELTPALLFIAVGAFVVNLVQEVSGFLLGRRHGRAAQAFGVLNIGGHNIGLFAMPYLAGMLGPQAIAYAIIFDVGNTLAAAGVGYAWGMSLSQPERHASPLGFLRQILRSPLFVTYLFLLVLGAFHLHLPRAVISFAGIVGGANTFLAMLMIGIGLDLNLDRTRLIRAARWLAARYAVCILSALAVWFLAPFDHEIRLVIVMVLFAPIASMGPALTDESGSDVQLSSFLNTVTILVAIVVLPSLMLLLHA